MHSKIGFDVWLLELKRSVSIILTQGLLNDVLFNSASVRVSWYDSVWVCISVNVLEMCALFGEK